MNKIRENKGMTILGVFLSWSIFKSVEYFIYPEVTDRVVLDHYDMSFLGNVIILSIITLAAISLFAVLKKKRWGIKALYSFFTANILLTGLVWVLAMINPQLVADSYRLSREARGLSIESVEWISAPPMIVVGFVIYLMFYALLTFWVNTKKGYFSD